MVDQIKGPDEKYCADCGAVIKARAEICPKCGVRQLPVPASAPAAPTTSRNKLVAALLALFLGGFGFHKFYLGQTLQGVLFLVFCWTFIPAIIAFFQAIGLMLMSEVEFAKRYPG